MVLDTDILTVDNSFTPTKITYEIGIKQRYKISVKNQGIFKIIKKYFIQQFLFYPLETIGNTRRFNVFL